MYLSEQSEDFLINKITTETGSRVSSLTFKSVGGGSINNTWRVITDTQQTFFPENK